MDYSVLHDGEINMKVCSALGLGLSGYARIIRQGDVTILLDDNKTLVDYCNNPADAWPIIVDNSIGIKKQSNGLWVSSRHGGMYPQYHENPIRAAMIVFLMMQDSANVPANSTGSDIR
ncbi:TPA: phage protein NinX family protein [Citrobacter freundii]|uniref:phage protein NinX family protein n=1 Tax=Citrobacter freundii TaxID=546 RepID=UPI001B8113EE|nr:DUF2591 family protein [Citrobacter freundii]HBC2000734.1 DUF2591 family protein [Citrobacter freundii]HBM9447422.1 DUF2591 family protein [Citrobacter freundii]HCC4674362.1 DUF2591 family protein [Citrobacter freundii]HCC4805863.1 DUF2591 family protein [Citrobacter freundii]